jgi:ABC-type antimicrobial peptide transport system permease subunit
VRIALGAQRGQILRMVLGNGISLALVGLLVGTVGAFFATPLMGGVLMDVNPRDPVVFLTIAVALIAATLGASWIPARRLPGWILWWHCAMSRSVRGEKRPSESEATSPGE